MSRKSQIRIAAEAAMSEAGVSFSNTVYIDKSKSGKRIKFAHTLPGDADMRIIRREFAMLFPTRDTRVWVVGSRYRAAAMYTGYSGIAFKVFNDE